MLLEPAFELNLSYLRSSSVAVFFFSSLSAFSPANIRNAASCGIIMRRQNMFQSSLREEESVTYLKWLQNDAHEQRS